MNAYRIASTIVRASTRAKTSGRWHRIHATQTAAVAAIKSHCDQLGWRPRDPRRRLIRACMPLAWELRQLADWRAYRGTEITPCESLMKRLHARLVAKAIRAVDQLPAGGDDVSNWSVTDYNPQRRLWTARAMYFHEYSRRAGTRHLEIGLVAGYEDGQYWARRVPHSHAGTISDAIDYLKPAAVKAAEAEGRDVRRQGDIWFVPLKNGRSNLGVLLGTDHRSADTDAGLVVRHPEHGELVLGAGAWRAYGSRESTRGTDYSD